MVRLILGVTIISLLLFVAKPVFAVSVTISNPPSTITDQAFNLDVSVSGAQKNTTNYLRVNLFPPGTIHYFGYTYNGTDFVNISDYSQYFPINIDSTGAWSGSIQAKLDIDSSYYSGPGTYSLKVRRYTQSGSYTWSNEVTLNINFQTPAPTPTSTPTPTLSPIPTSTPVTASSSKKLPLPATSTPSPTVPPTPKSSPSPVSTKVEYPAPPRPVAKTDSKIASVAAAQTSPPNIEIKSQKQSNLFLIAGLLLITAGIGLSTYIYLRSKILK